jgi:hypothetical protein
MKKHQPKTRPPKIRRKAMGEPRPIQTGGVYWGSDIDYAKAKMTDDERAEFERLMMASPPHSAEVEERLRELLYANLPPSS